MSQQEIHVEVLCQLLDMSMSESALSTVFSIFGEPTNDDPYTFEHVNAVLAERAFNFERPPTVEALIAKRVILIRTRRAAPLLGMDVNSVARLLRGESSLAFVRLSVSVLRVDQRAIEAQLAADRYSFSLNQAARILNVSASWVQKLIAHNKLPPVTKRHAGKINRDALLNFLGRNLHNTKMTPLEFAEGRLKGSIILISYSEAKSQLGATDTEMDWLLLSHLEYLRVSERGEYFITQASVRIWNARKPKA